MIDVVLVFAQPLLSDTVTVQFPAVSELAVKALPPEGDQVYVYGVSVPVMIAVALPLLPPKQDTLVDVTEIVNPLD